MAADTHSNPMKYKWRQAVRGSGLRIALIFTAATVSLLISVNVTVAQRNNQLFWASIPTHPSNNTNAHDIYYTTSSAQTQPHTISIGFTRQFQVTLIWITLAGSGLALALGLLLGHLFITRPLRRLQYAINQLKQSGFQPVKPTGMAEFDHVVADFNSLAGELQKAEILRKELISDTSHELKTPLQSLLLQIEGMRDGIIPKDATRFGHLLEQVHSLVEVSEHLQDYARMRSKLVHITPATNHLLPLVKAIASMYAEQCRQQNITVTYNISPSYTLICDASLLKRLLSNLFSNALVHARAHTITIEAARGHITFSDDGQGIETKHIPYLFERFYRANRSNASGIGLGLSIVHDIAKAHGWQIQVTSKKNKGTTFVIDCNETDTSKNVTHPYLLNS